GAGRKGRGGREAGGKPPPSPPARAGSPPPAPPGAPAGPAPGSRHAPPPPRPPPRAVRSAPSRAGTPPAGRGRGRATAHHPAPGGLRQPLHDPSRKRRTTLCSSRLRLFSSCAAEVIRATAPVCSSMTPPTAWVEPALASATAEISPTAFTISSL